MGDKAVSCHTLDARVSASSSSTAIHSTQTVRTLTFLCRQRWQAATAVGRLPRARATTVEALVPSRVLSPVCEDEMLRSDSSPSAVDIILSRLPGDSIVGQAPLSTTYAFWSLQGLNWVIKVGDE